MKTALFDFVLPPERIAKHPVSPRDASRLLFATPDWTEDRFIRDLPGLLKPSDLLVLNDTRVIPANLVAMRGQVPIRLNLVRTYGADEWQAFAKPGKRIKEKDILLFNNNIKAIIKQKNDDGSIILMWPDKNSNKCIELYGMMPLPSYLKRPEELSDKETYQTVYAQKPGAVAAPTAGLHFTKRLIKNIEKSGIKIAYLTLHVGAGTFLPVKSEDTSNHIMHTEYYEISEEVAGLVNLTRKNGGRIVCVGTTSLRALESAADLNGKVIARAGETEIFITPGYKFKVADLLLTNFHLPRSTLFMLVSAFMGRERMQALYRHAIEKEYRFYSYGDACLLERLKSTV